MNKSEELFHPEITRIEPLDELGCLEKWWREKAPVDSSGHILLEEIPGDILWLIKFCDFYELAPEYLEGLDDQIVYPDE